MLYSSILFTSDNVLLPGDELPQPATITVNTATGKITNIQPNRLQSPSSIIQDDVQIIDVGERYILPGLVEYVRTFSSHSHPN